MNDHPASAAELAALATDGFFSRAAFFSPPEISRIEAIADRAVAYHNEFPPHLRDTYKEISHKDGVTFVNEFGDDSGLKPALLRFAMQPRIRALARSIAGANAAHHLYQIVYKHPRWDQPFPWHQDHIHTPVDCRFYNVWVALSDMTIANGCLWMLPRLGESQIYEYHPTPYGYSCWPLDGGDQGQPIELARGSIVVNHSWTLHKSGGNTTDQFRKAILVAFVDARGTVHGEPVRKTPYDAEGENVPWPEPNAA